MSRRPRPQRKKSFAAQCRENAEAGARERAKPTIVDPHVKSLAKIMSEKIRAEAESGKPGNFTNGLPKDLLPHLDEEAQEFVKQHQEVEVSDNAHACHIGNQAMIGATNGAVTSQEAKIIV